MFAAKLQIATFFTYLITSVPEVANRKWPVSSNRVVKIYSTNFFTRVLASTRLLAAALWAITTMISIKIGTQTKKNMLSSKITKAEVQANFKMAAAAILEIQVHAINWAITTRF
jgi:hypothetical protein